MFKSDIKDRDVQVAVKASNWLLTDSMFYDEIAQIERFSHSELSGREVANILYENRHVTIIFLGYKTWYPYKWPFPKVKGYYSAENPNVINVNLRALPFMDKFDHIGNFIHEKMHSLGFKHKGNNPGKFRNRDSVPYKVGYLASSYAERKWNEEL